VRSDHVDELIEGSSGLRALVRALTSPATPRELAGEQLALAMFREVLAGHSRRRRLQRRPRLLRQRWRLAWIGGASVLALTTSFAAAGYAAVLPIPVQCVAHSLLGFAGVPGSGPRHHGRGRVVLPPTASIPSSAGNGHGNAPPTSQPDGSSPSAAAGTPVITARLAHSRVTAGAAVVVTARLTEHGRAVPGARLTLLELRAGGQGWLPAASATTDPAGWAVLKVPHLITNAAFKVNGPGRAASDS
jgi:hypothetical protein